jgi:segregation and condensation protein B
MPSDSNNLKNILEAVLFASDEALTIDNILNFFTDSEKPERKLIQNTLQELADDYHNNAIELKETARGFSFKVKDEFSPWVSKLWAESPPKYSRALLETLAIIAYRQPITRGEIEEIRGVSVSSHMIKTLLDREWIKVLGHKEVPGRPGLYGTTRDFLDYFGLKNLEELPPVTEIKDLEEIGENLMEQLGFAGKIESKEQKPETNIEINQNYETTEITEDTSQ